jgi:hypothetical protein
MVNNVTLYCCEYCGSRYVNEPDARSCCEEQIKLLARKNGYFRPKFPQKVTLYECQVCGMRHVHEELAKDCLHWSDDPEDFKDVKVTEVVGGNGEKTLRFAPVVISPK